MQMPGPKRRSVGRDPPGPILSLDEHEDSITELTNRAAPSRSTQPSRKTPSSAPKDRVRPRKDPIAVPDPSDNEPLSDQANEPKTKARKWDPTPELVVVDDDDSTPLPGKQKTPKKLLPAEDEATEKLIQRLKGEAQAVQYNLELAALVDYRNKSVPNLRGPPNTDDHSKYLSQVRDISWSYPAKGNLWTVRQFFQELQASENREMVEQGEAVLQDRGMLGIPQESGKSGPIKARYVIRVLRSAEGQIIDARDSDYGRDWNIGLYDIVSAASTKKVEKHGQMLWKGHSVSGKVSYGYCPFCSYASTNHQDSQQPHPDAPAPLLGLRDARLLVHHTQRREHVEARCYPQASDLGAYRCVQEEIDTGTIHSTRISPLSRRFIQNRQLRLPLMDRIVPATSLEDTQGIYFKQILQRFPFSYCNRKSGKQ